MNILLHGFDSGFYAFCSKLFCFDLQPKRRHYDIIAVSDNALDLSGLECSLLIAPAPGKRAQSVFADVCITVGMDRSSDISFSSITYDTAMLSVNGSISAFGRLFSFAERRVDFRENLSVYENLALNALCLFV